MTDSEFAPAAFSSLGLSVPVLRGLEAAGYTAPTPIQERTIPLLLEGRDVVGQAQTGTGKTAAFGLPLLAKVQPGGKDPQVLILAPTRELALQVADSLTAYARYMPELRVAAIYGGASFVPQLSALRRGVDVVVGTPGRVMDHMRRGTLRLDNLTCLVLDEADEMLRMGFIQDVEWILEQTPPTRQIALFSATMPGPIRRIAQQYLCDPATVTIQAATASADTVRQRYYYVRQAHKLGALRRILECEEPEGVVVFVRTKFAAVEVAEALASAGFAAAALNGDIAQKQREQTVEGLRDGTLDIVVATDVAARGIDVRRVSHVINFDMPQDPQVYVHRIGRTGRAGRTGEAILLLTPREERQLRAIERFTRQPLERFELPSPREMNARRVAKLKSNLARELAEAQASDELQAYTQVVEELLQESGADAAQLVAALARRLRGGEPLLLPEVPQGDAREKRGGERRRERGRAHGHDDERTHGRDLRRTHGRHHERGSAPRERRVPAGMDRYRVEVGSLHGTEPRALVGCIANEAGLDGKYIGRIDIREEFTLVELPQGMPRETLRALKRAWVAGRQLRMRKLPPHGEVRSGRRHAQPKAAEGR